MLDRVNTYLQRSPLWRSLVERQKSLLSSQASCAIHIGTNNAAFVYTPTTTGKIDLVLCKSLSFSNAIGFIDSLKDLVENANIRGTACTWVLAPTHYQLILMEDLPVEVNEFQSAIRWKIKGMIPFPIEDAVIDFFPVPMQKTYRPQKMIMVVVTRASYLHPIVDQIQRCGLEPRIIDIQETSLRNIVAMYDNDNETSSALIYLQKKQADLIITHQKNLYLARRIEIESEILNSSAEDKKHLLEKIALEIQRSFDFYQSQWRNPAPSRILFASTHVTTIAMAGILSTYLGAQVQELNINSILTNTAGITLEQQNKFLPIIGSLFREEINHHAATN